MKRRGPGYEIKLLQLLEAGVIALRPGELATADVGHHPRCPFVREPPGPCTCDPDIVLIQRGAA